MLMLVAAAATVPVAARPASIEVNPAAQALFESDWVLMGWALETADADGDRVLSPAEATQAAESFRSLADSDGDGRISRFEFSRARDFLVAR